jgi:hypothetical protein
MTQAMSTATAALKSAKKLSREAIEQINSLGGPELPMGVSVEQLKVILENRRAADAPFRDTMLDAVVNFAE